MPEFDLDAALMPPPVRYKVEMLFDYHWIDAPWSECDEGSDEVRPSTFASEEEAFCEIQGHCQDCREAYVQGDMTDYPELSDFRIVPAEVPRA